MYNRYIQAIRRAEPTAAGEERAEKQPPLRGEARPPTQSPAGEPAGLMNALRGLLGNRVELGDLLLYLILLLLYLEQEDEELLIVLAALIVLSVKGSAGIL